MLNYCFVEPIPKFYQILKKTRTKLSQHLTKLYQGGEIGTNLATLLVS